MENQKVKYKCEVCGRESDSPIMCHDKPMKKLCHCGSNNYSENCCD